ncbi:MAG: hydroxymethylglutaryl-CoA reductase [Fibrobacterales bacterium]
MPSQHDNVERHINSILESSSIEEIKAQLAPKMDNIPQPVEQGSTPENILNRLSRLALSEESQNCIADSFALDQSDQYFGNIENFIGLSRTPLGIAGPLRINGMYANGDYTIPLATTEAALVASYHRGSTVISMAGGCTALLLNEGISRSPGFIFNDSTDACIFIVWVQKQLETFKKIVANTTNYGVLTDMRMTIESNHVYLVFEYTTGDASGQNMVTIATQEICDFIIAQSPITPNKSYIEANLSGDKKASHLSFQNVRGKKVNSEVVIPYDLVKKKLNTTPKDIVEYWKISSIGGVLSGTIGFQGHYANGLTALYMACGQDVACVSESAVGITKMEITENNDLYASVNLPNIIIGTVGGGTQLPSQKACLDIMGLAGEGKARALAEVCASLCLAGEISIMSAITSGDFTRAHKVLARNRNRNK